MAEDEEEGSDGGSDDGGSDGAVDGGDMMPYDISAYDYSESTGPPPETKSVDSYEMFYDNSHHVVTPLHSYNKH